ncbi:hypothetical protein [Domibacillus aminovorans]|uniref:hypothetical protein n=1 Tax=Domibacillus aminovorans TaxID=29332 RepID=UPI0012FDD203|nr:hypothetical protein [Domibacillus aminovorans]
MGKIQNDNRVDPVLKEVIQMPAQANSTAVDVASLNTQINSLLQKLRDTGLMKN